MQMQMGEKVKAEKVIAICHNCGKQYNVTNWMANIKNVHCDCGGYIVNPGGHMKFRKLKGGRP